MSMSHSQVGVRAARYQESQQEGIKVFSPQRAKMSFAAAIRSNKLFFLISYYIFRSSLLMWVFLVEMILNLTPIKSTFDWLHKYLSNRKI